VLLLDSSITKNVSPVEQSACYAHESLSLIHYHTLSAPSTIYGRHAHHHHKTKASKSDDATRTANQFQRACAKHHRLAPVAPLSLSLTAGEGEGRSRTCHIFCLFPAVLHTRTQMHAYTHTHSPHSHHLFPICSLWDRAGWPGFVRRTRQLGCKPRF
jgi:hypothetical protein